MWCRTLRCIVILTLSLLVAPHTVEAQQAGKVWRVGLLEYTPIPERSLPEAFRTELRNLGYVEGKNIVIEFRSAEGRVDRLGALATELARLPVDVLVAIGSSAIRAAQQATSTIPIVMMTTTNAVERGFVASLARPGGNITGLAGPWDRVKRQTAGNAQGSHARGLAHRRPLESAESHDHLLLTGDPSCSAGLTGRAAGAGGAYPQ